MKAPPVHPIVMPDGRVPCDVCDALIPKAEAEVNFPAWQQHICDSCAEQYAEATPEIAGQRLPVEPDDLKAYVEELFTPERRKRALDWANTAEGRSFLDHHRAELQRHQPIKP